MLERENIDNFIADDLALRNRNWGQIEGELAEKATVTELTNGLDARYTKDETDGLFAVKLENFVLASHFNPSAGIWLSQYGTHSVTSNSVTVTGDGTNATLRAWHRLVKSEIEGEKHYLGAMVEISGEVPTNITTRMNAYSTNPVGINSPAIGVNHFLSGVVTMSGTYSTFPMVVASYTNATRQANGSFTVKSPIHINLTATFGAGNEPTKEEMDELIRTIGWFDGKISLSQKQVAIWTLNMIRKNRNAIVALGGTIA